MLEKWEQKIIHMNFKKAAIVFLVTGFILALAVPAALYGNFRGRVTDWEQLGETDREHGEREQDFRENGKSESGDRERDGEQNKEQDGEYNRDLRESEERDKKETLGEFRFRWSDFALLAGCAVTGMALGIWYWLLVVIWAYRKAHRMGVNARLAALGALCFNLGAVAVLYLYGLVKGTCASCGRVRSGNEKFCVRCGNPLRKECPNCKQETELSSAYCGNCGSKLAENEEA